MPFDAAQSPYMPSPQKIAVVGTGVSGLSAAWQLSKSCNVVVYEKAGRLGGHSNTVDAETAAGPTPVDTGFIVYNEPAYPNFTALLDHLGVASEASCMSFGVSMNSGAVEYSGQTFSSVFARRSNAASPTFWKMLTDIPRFHRDARDTLRAGFCEHASLGDFVAHGRYGQGFQEHFLKPMAAAIWSTPQMKVFDYPAFSFLRFFENHGLLQVLNLPAWRTVSGGSRTYVAELAKAFEGGVRLNAGAARIERIGGKVQVTDTKGHRDVFDAVVMATHADTARNAIADLDARERSILSAFAYQENRAVLHMDARHMPRRRRAWSSWNYIGDGDNGAVTYWMNRLQNLRCTENIFVTLNPAAEIDPAKVVAEFSYDHPMFNGATERAQEDIWTIQGRGGVWYAGAHLGHGFHEDGLQSGLAVAESLGGVKRPWTVSGESSRLKLQASMGAAA